MTPDIIDTIEQPERSRPADVLAAVPGCGRPAVARVEGYSPRATLYGSLDLALYVCADHQAQAVEAIEGGRSTSFCRPVTGSPRCGDGWDYTTKPMRSRPAPGADR